MEKSLETTITLNPSAQVKQEEPTPPTPEEVPSPFEWAGTRTGFRNYASVCRVAS